MKSFLFIMWIIGTIVLTLSVVGMLLFIPVTRYYSTDPSTPSSWMAIGKALAYSITSNTKQ